MSNEISQQDALRNNITYDMFVDPADQNYVVARWCFQRNLPLDFLWNAAHCLEKMMKAALLLNGCSAKSSEPGQPSYGHDLTLLYPQLVRLAGDLLPDMLIKPNEIEMHWRVEASEAYVARISANGDAHNRYQIYGHVLHKEDLYKFDRIVFAVRRLCCPLDSYVFGKTTSGSPTVTLREVLSKQPEFMPHMVGSRWQKLVDKRSSPDLRHAALNHNFMFGRDYEHTELRSGIFALNPVLGRRILQADEQGATGKEASETVDLIDWVVENIFLPRPVKDQLVEARSRLAARV